MNQDKLNQIRYDLELFLQDFNILSLKDKKFRARSILWKLNLCKLSPRQLSKRAKLGAKVRLNKIALQGLTDNSLKN